MQSSYQARAAKADQGALRRQPLLQTASWDETRHPNGFPSDQRPSPLPLPEQASYYFMLPKRTLHRTDPLNERSDPCRNATLVSVSHGALAHTQRPWHSHIYQFLLLVIAWTVTRLSASGKCLFRFGVSYHWPR